MSKALQVALAKTGCQAEVRFKSRYRDVNSYEVTLLGRNRPGNYKFRIEMDDSGKIVNWDNPCNLADAVAAVNAFREMEHRDYEEWLAANPRMNRMHMLDGEFN